VHIVAALPGLKVWLVALTHETKYATGTMKFADLLEFRGSSDPKDPPPKATGQKQLGVNDCQYEYNIVTYLTVRWL